MPKVELSLGIKSGFPTKNGGLPVQNSGLLVQNGGLPTIFVSIIFFKIFKFRVNFEKTRLLIEIGLDGFGKPSG